jgi:fatty acid desaturase
MYQYKESFSDNDELYYRSLLSSANYSTGTEFLDFTQGYLNYQIEHHMFPDLSPLEYRLIAPLVKSICQKYNMPYIQENVFIRLFKLFRFVILDQEMIQHDGIVYRSQD